MNSAVVHLDNVAFLYEQRRFPIEPATEGEDSSFDALPLVDGCDCAQAVALAETVVEEFIRAEEVVCERQVRRGSNFLAEALVERRVTREVEEEVCEHLRHAVVCQAEDGDELRAQRVAVLCVFGHFVDEPEAPGVQRLEFVWASEAF